MNTTNFFLPGRFVALSLGFFLVSASNAALIVYDGFDYNPGQSLNGNGNQDFSWGTNRWGRLPDGLRSDWCVFPGSLSHPSVLPMGGHVAETNNSLGANYERKFAPVTFQDGDALWFSFLVKVTQGTSWGLYLTSSGQNSNKFGVAGIFPDYEICALIGIGYNGSTETIDLGQNITRLIVARYRYSASDMEQLDIWVDPDITAEPQPGDTNTPNHIVHFRRHDLEPAGADSVLLEERSIGSLAFDELRVGTTWKDVVPTAIDRVVIDRIIFSENLVNLELSKLTPGTTTTVERATQLGVPSSWEEVDSFVPTESSTNWTAPAINDTGFYRIRLR